MPRWQRLAIMVAYLAAIAPGSWPASSMAQERGIAHHEFGRAPDKGAETDRRGSTEGRADERRIDNPSERAVDRAQSDGLDLSRRSNDSSTLDKGQQAEVDAHTEEIRERAEERAGRSKNRLSPDDNAEGEHTTFKRAQDGTITNYATYKPESRNPSGFQEQKRVDLSGASHYDKSTGTDVPTPHVEETGEKGVRPASPEEIPK
jgi:Bacterial toxin 24